MSMAYNGDGDGLTDEMAARALHAELLKLGVPCRVHWDRSPWGVAVPLVTDEEGKPTLFVLTEDEFKFGMRVWHIVTDGYTELLDDVLECFVTEFIQRGDFGQAASILASYVEFVKHGAQRSYMTLA